MANIIQQKSGTAVPASDALAKGELAIRFEAANHTASSSSKLYFGEGDSANLRQFGFGITDEFNQSGVAIGENLTFSGGTGLDITVSGTTVQIAQDLSEFTDMTADVDGTQDELILLDNGAERRKRIDEIKLSQFNNDAGFVTSAGTLTGIDDQSSSNDDQITITDSAVIINEDSDNLDFRVESNDNANMLFVDGQNNRVGIGKNDPSAALDITGGIITSASITAGSNLTVTGDARIKGSNKLYFGDTDTTEYITTAGTDDLRIHASDTVVIDGDGKSIFRTPYLALETSAASEKIRFDIDNGRVGIGTNAPAVKLDVRDEGWPIAALHGTSQYGTGIQFYNTHTTDQAWAIVAGGTSQSNYPLKFYDQTNTVYRMVLDNTGKLGIGTESPVSKLHVSESASADVTLALSNSNTGHTINDGFQFAVDTSKNAYIINRESSDLKFYTSNAQKMVIKSDGKVGVGTNSPDVLFHVSGSSVIESLRINSNEGDRIRLYKRAGNEMLVASESASLYLNSAYNGIYFENSSSDVKMRMDDNGNFGIGNTSPSSTLDVTGTFAVSGNATIGGNLALTGNLTVNGTTTTVNSTTMTVDDPIITLGGDSAPASDDNKDRGVEFRYHDGSSARVGFFGFDDSTGKFTALTAATNTSEVFSGTAMPAVFGAFEGTTGDFSSNLAVGGNLTVVGSISATGDIGGQDDIVINDDCIFKDNVSLDSDGAILSFGDDGEVNLTHAHDAGLILNSTNYLAFDSSANRIFANSGVLSLYANSEVELNATNIDINGATDISGNLTIGGNIVAAGDITADVGGEITLDTDSGNIRLKDGGTQFGMIRNSSTHLVIDNTTEDKDILFKGNDGGSTITALRLHMASEGLASFNADVQVGDDLFLNTDSSKIGFGADNDVTLLHVPDTGLRLNSTRQLQFNNSDEAISSNGTNLRLKSGGTTFVVPSSDGSSGQFLKTDGAGNLSFATVSSGGVDTTGTVNADEFPQFTDSNTLQALTATQMRSALNVDDGADNYGQWNLSVERNDGGISTGGIQSGGTARWAAGEGLDIEKSGAVITYSAEDATSSNKGIASFSTDNFAVSSGAVTIKDGGVANAELANSTISGVALGGNLGLNDLSDATYSSGVLTIDDGSNATQIDSGNQELKIVSSHGSNGHITVDAGGEIILSADDNGEVHFREGSSTYAKMQVDTNTTTGFKLTAGSNDVAILTTDDEGKLKSTGHTWIQAHHFGFSNLDNNTATYLSWVSSNSNQTNVFNHRGLMPCAGRILKLMITADAALSNSPTFMDFTLSGSSSFSDAGFGAGTMTYDDSLNRVFTSTANYPLTLTEFEGYTWAAGDTIVGTLTNRGGSNDKRAQMTMLIEWQV